MNLESCESQLVTEVRKFIISSSSNVMCYKVHHKVIPEMFFTFNLGSSLGRSWVKVDGPEGLNWMV